MPGRRTGQARHPAARGPQPAGEFPTHSRAAPRLPRSLGRGRPLQGGRAETPLRPLAAAASSARECALRQAARASGTRRQAAACPCNLDPELPVPCKANRAASRARHICLGVPPCGVFSQYQKTVAQIAHAASSNSVPEPTSALSGPNYYNWESRPHIRWQPQVGV